MLYMIILRSIGIFIAKYFIFVVGFLFVFVIGGLYALLQPDGWVGVIFLFITVGWIIYLIKHFWEVMDKNKKIS
jgi:membrane protein implicated in regulation of membrane protease activity